MSGTEWKKRLFRSGVLPSAKEWSDLDKSQPTKARALRRYLTELIGVLDPLFQVSIRNESDQPQEISSLTYTAKYLDTSLAEIMSGFERARYVLTLREGRHTEPLNPPIIVPAKGLAQFDLMITLDPPRPGAAFDVQLAFGTPENNEAIPLRNTQMVFWRGKAPTE